MKLTEIYKNATLKWGETPEQFTDKGTWHSYIETYETIFEQLTSVKLLEIGISSGGSAWLWREYCQLNNKSYNITSIDIRPTFVEMHSEYQDVIVSDTNINLLWKRDCFNPETYSTLDKFNLIIDDGPHTLSSQITILNHALPKLEVGGFYIIEDIAESPSVEILENHALSVDPSLKVTKYFGLKNNRNDDVLLILHKM